MSNLTLWAASSASLADVASCFLFQVSISVSRRLASSSRPPAASLRGTGSSHSSLSGGRAGGGLVGLGAGGVRPGRPPPPATRVDRTRRAAGSPGRNTGDVLWTDLPEAFPVEEGDPLHLSLAALDFVHRPPMTVALGADQPLEERLEGVRVLRTQGREERDLPIREALLDHATQRSGGLDPR